MRTRCGGGGGVVYPPCVVDGLIVVLLNEGAQQSPSWPSQQVVDERIARELHQRCGVLALASRGFSYEDGVGVVVGNGVGLDGASNFTWSVEALLARAASELNLGRGAASLDADPVLLAAATRVAALAAFDQDTAPALLEEPWLSFLASVVGLGGTGPTASPGDCVLDAVALGAAAALSSVAHPVSENAVFWQTGPGEAGTRGIARLRNELLLKARVAPLLRRATVVSSQRGTYDSIGVSPSSRQLGGELEPDPEELTAEDATCCKKAPQFEYTVGAATHALAVFCRSLVRFLADDLGASGILIECGVVPAVLNACTLEGEATIAELGAVLAEISVAPGFAAALGALPPQEACAIVELASADMLRIDQAQSSGVPIIPALRALFNLCRAAPPAPLPQWLVDRGAVGLIVDICSRRIGISTSIRLEAADALCRLLTPMDQDAGELAMEPAVLNCLAAAPTVGALVSLSHGDGDCSQCEHRETQLQEVFRYRLPWLLSCVARGAASSDLMAWIDEEAGVRKLLSDALRDDRSRDVREWGLDIIVTICGRLSPAILLAFLRRGPHPVLDSWHVLLKTARPSVKSRAIIVLYFVLGSLPTESQAARFDIHQNINSQFSRRGVLDIVWGQAVPTDAFSAPSDSKSQADHRASNFGPSMSESVGNVSRAARRQLAELASAAAAGTVSQQWPPETSWPSDSWDELITLCRLVTTGLDAHCALNSSGSDACLTLRAWLLEACDRLSELLFGAVRAERNAEQLPADAIAFLTALLGGSSTVESKATRKRASKDDGGESYSDPDSEEEECACITSRKLGPNWKGDASKHHLRDVASSLLEQLMLDSMVFPSIEDALQKTERRDDTSSAHHWFVVLVEVVKGFGRLEYGRLLARLLLRTCIVVSVRDVANPSGEGDEYSDVASRAVRLAALFKRDREGKVGWLPVYVPKTEMSRLDANLVVGVASWRCNDAIPLGGPLLRRFVGGLLAAVGSQGKRRGGLRAILRFLLAHARERRDLRSCKLASVVLSVVVANLPLLTCSDDSRVCAMLIELGSEMLGVAAEAAAFASYADQDVNKGLAFQSMSSAFEVHASIIKALQLASVAPISWAPPTLADAFAYLWALMHSISIGGMPPPYDSIAFEEVGDRSTCSLRLNLWRLCSDALHVMLGSYDIVGLLCHSDDNAVSLSRIRHALGDVAGSFPLFARACIQQPKPIASYFFGPPPRGCTKDMLGRATLLTTVPSAGQWIFLDLHEERWCAPGRILLAAFVIIASVAHGLALAASDESAVAIMQLLAVVLASAGRVIATTARPGALLLSGEDVVVVLTSAASIVTQPPGEGAERDDLRRLAGLLMVPLLHRPPVEELLRPKSSMEALGEVPGGLDALRWCARPDIDTGLGMWGSHARQLLNPPIEVAPKQSLTEIMDGPFVVPDLSIAVAEADNNVASGINAGLRKPRLHLDALGESATLANRATCVAVQTSCETSELAKLHAEVNELDSDLALLEAELQAEREAEGAEYQTLAEVNASVASPPFNWRLKCVSEQVRANATAKECSSNPALSWEDFSPVELACLCAQRHETSEGLTKFRMTSSLLEMD